jgi:hypothetical protein
MFFEELTNGAALQAGQGVTVHESALGVTPYIVLRIEIASFASVFPATWCRMSIFNGAAVQHESAGNSESDGAKVMLCHYHLCYRATATGRGPITRDRTQHGID